MGILIDKTCPSYDSTASSTIYFPGTFSPYDPTARCFCPCLNCNFIPNGYGNLCQRQASLQEAFVRDGTLSDYAIDPFTG